VTGFLAAFNVQIQLAAEAAKEQLLAELVNSRSFSTTHEAIANLQQYLNLLSSADAERLIRAAETNTQISWILSDPDIEEFYARLSELHPRGTSDISLARLRGELEKLVEGGTKKQRGM
jgi:hypothetical protein